MEAYFIVIIVLTIVVPIGLMFLKDKDRRRGRIINYLIAFTILAMYLPVLLTLATDEPYFWYLFVSVPAGGLVLLVLSVLKVLFAEKRGPSKAV